MPHSLQRELCQLLLASFVPSWGFCLIVRGRVKITGDPEVPRALLGGPATPTEVLGLYSIILGASSSLAPPGYPACGAQVYGFLDTRSFLHWIFYL